MSFGHRHWAVALLAAALLQLALAAALYRPYQHPGGDRSGGVEIELGPLLNGVAGLKSPGITTSSTESLPDLEPLTSSQDLRPADSAESTAVSKATKHAVTIPTRPLTGVLPLPVLTPPALTEAAPKPAAETKANPNPEKKNRRNVEQNRQPGTRIAATTDTERQPSSGSDLTALSASKIGTGGAASTTSGSANAALSTPGSGTAATDSQEYYHTLAAWLEKHKRYPRRAIQRRQEGVVKVAFRIDRQGNLLSREIVASSGYHLLDEAADALLLRASPMPGIPQRLTAQVLEFTVPIMYALR